MHSLPQTRSDLLEQLRQAESELEDTITSLPDEQLGGPRDAAGWSVQDHLDHLAAWEEGAAALLERRPRYEAMGVDSATVEAADEDQFNAIIRERTPHRAPAETRAALRASHEHLLRALEPLSDDDLRQTYSHFQPQEPGEDSGQPITAWVVGNSSGHYREHLPWIRAILRPPDEAGQPGGPRGSVP